MKNFACLVGGACIAAAGFWLWKNSNQSAVPRLAHQLEDAWADHHTIA